MRRVSYFMPRGGLTPEATARVLQLVGIERATDQLSELTELELLTVYDYAMRVHLKASDGKLRARPRPVVLDRLRARESNGVEAPAP